MFGGLIGRLVHRSAVAARWHQGAAGERRTGRQLRPLEREGWTILHDRAIPGSRANLDHLLIGPPGVLYLDTKHWRAGRAQIRHGELWNGRHNQTKSLGTVVWEASQAAKALETPVRAVVCLHRQSHLRIAELAAADTTVTVLPSDVLLDWLRVRPARWNTAQVEACAARAATALPPYTR